MKRKCSLRQLLIIDRTEIADSHAVHLVPLHDEMIAGIDCRSEFLDGPPLRMTDGIIIKDRKGLYRGLLPKGDNLRHTGTNAVRSPTGGNPICIGRILRRIKWRLDQRYRRLARGGLRHEQIGHHVDANTRGWTGGRNHNPHSRSLRGHDERFAPMGERRVFHRTRPSCAVASHVETILAYLVSRLRVEANVQGHLAAAFVPLVVEAFKFVPQPDWRTG